MFFETVGSININNTLIMIVMLISSCNQSKKLTNEINLVNRDEITLLFRSAKVITFYDQTECLYATMSLWLFGINRCDVYVSPMVNY